MNTFIVLYREKDNHHGNPPAAFLCSAEGADHAEEQCASAYPEADIVWVWENDATTLYRAALKDYYGN